MFQCIFPNSVKMENETEILEQVLSEFPNKKKEISTLYLQSSSFIEICEDYVVCRNSIQQLEVEEDSINNKNLHHLKLALAELKEELLSKI